MHEANVNTIAIRSVAGSPHNEFHATEITAAVVDGRRILCPFSAKRMLSAPKRCYVDALRDECGAYRGTFSWVRAQLIVFLDRFQGEYLSKCHAEGGVRTWALPAAIACSALPVSRRFP
jgi:hypothetical protein